MESRWSNHRTGPNRVAVSRASIARTRSLDAASLDPDADDLRRRLFRDVRFAEDLEPDERERYRTANDEANRYAGALERQFVEPDRLDDMVADLRRFYRLSLGDKLAHISRAAR